MIDLDYAARHLGGVWKMAWNERGWEEAFDRSVDGVFKSFWAAAFVAPIVLARFISFHHAESRIPPLEGGSADEAPLWFALAAEAIAFIADWSAELIALVLAARAAGATRRIASIIIGFNWAQVYMNFAQAVPLIIFGVTYKRELAGFASLPMIVFIIAFYCGVLRRGLNAGIGATIAVFALVSLLGLITTSLISAGATGLYQLLP